MKKADHNHVRIEGLQIDPNAEIKVTVSFRHYMSISHIQAAALFARLAGQIELEETSLAESKRIAYESYGTSSILLSLAFLEALINEIIADAIDHPFSELKQLGRNTIKRLSEYAKLESSQRAGTLDKFQMVLILANKTLFQKERQPYQDAFLLRHLRNLLVHYYPEWISDAPDLPEHKLARKLKGKFEINPFAGAGNPFFPDKCIGYGCAKWSVTASLKFADEFFSKIGITPTYDHVRDTLSVISSSE